MGTANTKKGLQKLIGYWPVYVIFFVWILFGRDYFFQGRVPFPSTFLVSFFTPWNNYFGGPVKNGAMPDVITQIYPWKSIAINALKNGELAVWNPHQFSGNPHLANVQSAVFSPFNLLFFILPFVDGWSLLILLQPLLAGLCTYLYLRTIKLSKGASLLGSISFMFCSFIVTWMAYGTLGYALLFLPLFLYGIERYLEHRDRLGAFILIISPPLTIFSGHFQTSVYVLIVSIFYLVLRSISNNRARMLPKSLLFVLTGIIISCIQIVPAYHFYSRSVRSQSYIQNEVIPWTQFLRIVTPDFFGNPVTRNDWVGYYAEWGTYAGIIPFILALLLLLKNKKDFHIYFFFSVFIISVLFSFDTPFVGLLGVSKIPVLSTSTPSRIVGIISFSIAVLSAFGLDFLKNEWHERKKIKPMIVVLSTILIVVGVIWIMLLTNSVFFMNHTLDIVMIAKRNFFITTSLVLITSTIVGFGYIKRLKLKTILVTVLILLVAFEMVRFSTKWMPFETKDYVYPHLPVLDFLSTHADSSRVYGLIGNEAISMFGLYGIEGYDPLYVKRYGEFISTVSDGKIHTPERSAVVFPKSGQYAQEALNLMGVKYIIHSKGDGRGSWVYPFWTYPESYGDPVFFDDKYEVYENMSAYPRAYLVHSYVVEGEDQNIIDKIYSTNTDVRKTVILEEEPQLAEDYLICPKIDQTENAIITDYKSSEVTITTSSPCNSLLFLSDVYYPGWVAYIDGKKTPIYRANYAFRTIAVPQGEHELRFKYENWYL